MTLDSISAIDIFFLNHGQFWNFYKIKCQTTFEHILIKNWETVHRVFNFFHLAPGRKLAVFEGISLNYQTSVVAASMK